MADLIGGAVVSELLAAAIKEVELAAKHKKLFMELLEMLHSLQGFLREVKHSIDSEYMQRWLKKLEECLIASKTLAREYQNAPRPVRWVMPRRILRVMEQMKDLIHDGAFVNVAQVHALDKRLLEIVNRQHELVNYAELAVCTFECTQSERYTKDAAKYKINEVARKQQTSQPQLDEGSSSKTGEVHYGDVLSPIARQVPVHVFGAEEMATELESALVNDDNSSKWIGVWGKGGAGKTLLSQLANNSRLVQAHFKGSIYWLTVGQNPTIGKLLATLSSRIPGCPRVSELEQQEDAHNKIYSYCYERKILIILDDVWDQVVLEQLDVVEASAGSKILVTSRIKDMFHRLQRCTLLEVKMLSPENSWKLFSSHAFPGVDEPDKKLQAVLVEVAKEVTLECKGLPLALKVIGSTMAGKHDVAQWRSSLKKLKDAQVLNMEHEREVIQRLKLSYDELPNADKKRGETLQTAFIYFAAFREDADVEVEVLIKYWVGEGLITSEDDDDDEEAEVEGYYILGQLIGRSLIELETGWSTTQSTKFLSCKIHDVLRDMVFYILEHNQEIQHQTCLFQAGKNLADVPERWYNTRDAVNLERISMTGNRIEELSRPLKAPMLKVLLLNENKNLARISLPFFTSFKNLTVLDLARTGIEELPKAISKLANLVVLEMSYCSRLTTVTGSIGKLIKLEYIGMQNCGKLENFPLRQLTNLVQLRYLNTRGCGMIWDQDDIDNVQQQCCPQLARRNKKPQGVDVLNNLLKLAKLWISSLKRDNLPGALSRMEKLRHLSALFPSIRSLPDLQALGGLQILDLASCTRLEELPDWLPTSLSSLETLDLRACSSLQRLPRGLEKLNGLSKLDLSMCQRLTSVPEEWGEPDSFPCLAELWLTGCGLDKLPEFKPGAMRCLSLINCVDCAKLQRVPDSITMLSSLNNLNFNRCINIIKIPGDSALLSLENLEVMILSGTGINTLPATISRLPRLKKLSLGSCKQLEMLPAPWEDGQDLFPRLEDISLAKSGVKKLAQGILTAPELQKIDVSDCNQELYEPKFLSVLQNRKLVHIVGWPIQEN